MPPFTTGSRPSCTAGHTQPASLSQDQLQPPKSDNQLDCIWESSLSAALVVHLQSATPVCGFHIVHLCDTRMPQNVDRKSSYPHCGDNRVDNAYDYPHIGDNSVDSLGTIHSRRNIDLHLLHQRATRSNSNDARFYSGDLLRPDIHKHASASACLDDHNKRSDFSPASEIPSARKVAKR